MSEPSGRSLPWFRVDVDLVDHPKVLALATELDCAEAEAGWLVVRLWAWTMRYAARGRLADGARPALERLWTGAETAPGSTRVVDGLVRAGFLDALDGGGWEVHDWDEHNGAAVLKAEKDAERKRAARARRSNGRGLSADGRADGAGNGTGRDGTEQKKHSVEQAPLLPAPEKPKTQRVRPMAIKTDDMTDDEWAVFDHWRVSTGKLNAMLDPKRLALIRRWLATPGITVQRLQRAIDGCCKTPWNRGENPNRKKYLDLELILRDAAQFEKFEAAA